MSTPRVVGYWSVATLGTTTAPDKAMVEAARPFLEEAQSRGEYEASDGFRLWRFTSIDPDPRHYETEPPPPSRPRGVVVIGLVLLALGIAVAVWGWHPWP